MPRKKRGEDQISRDGQAEAHVELAVGAACPLDFKLHRGHCVADRESFGGWGLEAKKAEGVKDGEQEEQRGGYAIKQHRVHERCSAGGRLTNPSGLSEG